MYRRNSKLITQHAHKSMHCASAIAAETPCVIAHLLCGSVATEACTDKQPYAGQAAHHYLSRFHDSLPHLGPRPLPLTQCCPTNRPSPRLLHVQLSSAQLRQQ
jgi:hypothetical protein